MGSTVTGICTQASVVNQAQAPPEGMVLAAQRLMGA